MPALGDAAANAAEVRVRRVWCDRGRSRLAVACLLAGVAASIALPAGEPPFSDHTTQDFGPFLTTAGSGFVVKMDYLQRKARPESQGKSALAAALTNLVIVNGTGRTVFERPFAPKVTATGFFAPALVGTAYEVHASTGAAIVVEACLTEEGRVPANASGWMIAFVRRGDALQQVSPEISFHGQLEHFPGPPLGPRRLVDGDLMRTREWTGHFSMIRSFHADLAAPAITPGCTVDCTIPAMAHAETVVAGRTIHLSSAPCGPSDPVRLRSGSKVELLDAFVRDFRAYRADSDVPCERPWLHVRIDGQEGWITTASDLAALGLPFSP